MKSNERCELKCRHLHEMLLLFMIMLNDLSDRKTFFIVHHHVRIASTHTLLGSFHSSCHSFQFQFQLFSNIISRIHLKQTIISMITKCAVHNSQLTTHTSLNQMSLSIESSSFSDWIVCVCVLWGVDAPCTLLLTYTPSLYLVIFDSLKIEMVCC